MGMSVPGNSCRTGTRCWAPSTGADCLMRLPGTCIYYSGGTIAGPGINTGNTLNIVVGKIIDYIDSLPTPAAILGVVSDDFEPDGVTCNLPQLAGLQFELFFNDLNRFIYNEVGNQE